MVELRTMRTLDGKDTWKHFVDPEKLKEAQDTLGWLKMALNKIHGDRDVNEQYEGDKRAMMGMLYGVEAYLGMLEKGERR